MLSGTDAMTDLQIRNEDALRLHVMANQCEAIRIDESRMVVYGLIGNSDQAVYLNPNCRDEQYLKLVKELLSSQAINHPGGYPVFLSRWTRMGQMDSHRLEALLKLGESEAVIAVASSPGITPELARRAWWAHPCSETARFLLANNIVSKSEVALELAEFLLEFLPFETEPANIATSTSLVLQPGLSAPGQIEKLWERGKRKTSILLGFLERYPDSLPGADRYTTRWTESASHDKHMTEAQLATLTWCQSAAGQIFIQTCQRILHKPADEQIVSRTLEVIRRQLSAFDWAGYPAHTIEQIETEMVDANLRTAPSHQADFWSKPDCLRFLSRVGESLLRGHFATSTAVGSLMRKQLGPILDPVDFHLKRLQNP